MNELILFIPVAKLLVKHPDAFSEKFRLRLAIKIGLFTSSESDANVSG